MNKPGEITTTVTVRVVEVKKGVVTLAVEGWGLKVTNLPVCLTGMEHGKNDVSNIRLLKGDSLELPYKIDINYE